MKGLSIVVVLSCVASVLAQDAAECYPSPEMHQTSPGECCRMQEIIPHPLKNAVMQCKDKYPRPARPTGPRPTGPPPEMKDHRVCMAECVFIAANLTTQGKVLNETAVKQMLITNNTDLSAVLESAKTTCLASYKSAINSTSSCTSGSYEFQQCFGREVFKNCPTSLWNPSSECVALKAKMDKCPNMPFMMGPGRGGPGHHHQRQ